MPAKKLLRRTHMTEEIFSCNDDCASELAELAGLGCDEAPATTTAAPAKPSTPIAGAPAPETPPTPAAGAPASESPPLPAADPAADLAGADDDGGCQ